MSKLKVLIVDDDSNVCEILGLYLKENHYEVIEANNGNDAIELYKNCQPDIILLDIMMPDIDGYEVCKEIRKNSTVPIIMLTAKDEEFDKVLGLEIGADDYVTKPFSPREVMARIKAIFRRMPAITETPDKNEDYYKFGTFSVSVKEREVSVGNKKLFFRPKEFDLLLHLIRHPNVVHTREKLLEQVWGYDFAGDIRTVDVHIKRIRDEFAAHDIEAIHTVWGVGYQFQSQSKG